MKFEVDDATELRIQKWLKTEVYPVIINEQKASVKNPDIIYQDFWKSGYPYTGAIGGGVQYCFMPTTIGVILIVKWHDGRFEKNFTDFENW